jgi:PBP1b-binding outer membrane lipoprotein LpoB
MKTILFLLIILVLGGCSSPQKLIDRAIKRDPSIVNTFSDTITINKAVIDSFLVVRNDTSYFEKIVRVVEFDTIINLSGIEIERKKTRQEIRKNAKLERLTARKDAKIRKLELKNERIQAKLDAKTDKKKVKEDAKTERTTVRQENKRNGFFWFWWGLLIGCVVGIAFKYLLKYLKTFLLK